MKKIIGVALILAGLAIGLFCIPSITEDTPEEMWEKLRNGNEKAVTEELTSIAEMSSLEYDYSNVVVLSDSEKLFKKISIPFTSKNIVMSYDGVMKIGTDCSKMKVSVEKGTENGIESVKIALPKMEIVSNEVDRATLDFPVEDGALINKLKAEDFDLMESKAEKEIEQTVESSDVMNQAKKELQDSLTGFLQGLYGEDIKVTFVDL